VFEKNNIIQHIIIGWPLYSECLQSEMRILNLLKPTGHVMHQQFNIQQLYVLPHTVFMCFVFI
jgi:hypothetical protein